MEKQLCPNCGCEIDTPYCPCCGQRYGEACVTWATLWEGAMSTFIGDGFDGEKGVIERYGLLGTLWQIVRHPIRTVTGFLAGHRRRYFNPFALLLLLSGFCALLNMLFGVKVFDLYASTQFEGGALSHYLITANEYASTHPAVYVLVVLPFVALACKWVFRPKKLRYIEFFYIEIFTSIISVIILILTFVVSFQLHLTAVSLIKSIPTFCVEIAIYRHIFGRSILRTAGNLILIYIISTVIFTLLISAALFIGGFTYAISTSV